LLQLEQAVAALKELGRDRAQTPTRVAQRQSRPLRQVTLIARRVAAEIPACKLRERVLAVDRSRRAEPVPGQYISVVLPEKRPANGDTAQAGEHEQMNERLSRGGHADRCHVITQLVTRQRAVFGQCARDRTDCAFGCARRDSGLRWDANLASTTSRLTEAAPLLGVSAAGTDRVSFTGGTDAYARHVGRSARPSQRLMQTRAASRLEIARSTSAAARARCSRSWRGGSVKNASQESIPRHPFSSSRVRRFGAPTSTPRAPSGSRSGRELRRRALACASLDPGAQAALRDGCFRRLGSPVGPFTLTARAWFVRGSV
jgi:hypothetical protein